MGDPVKAPDSTPKKSMMLVKAEAWQRARASSDLLLIFLLKAHRPDIYRETTRHWVSGPGGQPIEVKGKLAYEEYRAAFLGVFGGVLGEAGPLGLEAPKGDGFALAISWSGAWRGNDGRHFHHFHARG